MLSKFGENIKFQISGESHGKEYKVTIKNLPYNLSIDLDKLQKYVNKRTPFDTFSTSRHEEDLIITNSIKDGKLVSNKFDCVLKNKNFSNKEYLERKFLPRPSHGDYAQYIKYGKILEGGGHFSGRITLPIAVCGGICKQMLEKRNIFSIAYVKQIGDLASESLNFLDVDKRINEVEKNSGFISAEYKEKVVKRMQDVQKTGDSLGGVIECIVYNLPAGLGEPNFNGIENAVSKAVFAIPSVKGIEFGAGFSSAERLGSENNDQLYYDNRVKTYTNNDGGITGGLTNGMPLVVRVALKPIPSIYKEQTTVDLQKLTTVPLKIEGKHDSCAVPRAVVAVESCVLMALADFCAL